jgi:hypothetical protein
MRYFGTHSILWYASQANTQLHFALFNGHLAICALISNGQLYMREREGALKGPDVVGFLRHLLRKIPSSA